MSRGAHQGSSRLQNRLRLLWFSQKIRARPTLPSQQRDADENSEALCRGRRLHMGAKTKGKFCSGADATYIFMGNCCFFFPECVPESQWWNIRLFDMKSPGVPLVHGGDTSQHVASAIATTTCGLGRGTSLSGVAFFRSACKIGEADPQT